MMNVEFPKFKIQKNRIVKYAAIRYNISCPVVRSATDGAYRQMGQTRLVGMS